MIFKELRRRGLNLQDMNVLKDNIRQQTDKMADHCKNCTSLISKNSYNLMRDGMTILVHSYSRAVVDVLKSATDRGL